MPYPLVSGTVVRGRGLGRQLGFPTANIRVNSGKILKRGVYRVEVNGAGFSGRLAVCNVGLRPTLGQDVELQVEIHIPGFTGDLYGQKLSILFLKKIREERKFATLELLIEQIRRDIESLNCV